MNPGDGPVGSPEGTNQSEGQSGSRFLRYAAQSVGLGLVCCVSLLLLFPKGLFPDLKLRASQLYTCERNLDELAVALNAYAGDHASRYPRTLAELVPGYLDEIPRCRAAGRDTYSSGYQNTEAGFTVCCCGENHSISNWPAIATKHKFDKH